MLSVFAFINNDTCCLFFCRFSLCYMRFGLTGQVANDAVEKYLLASTNAISQQIEYATEIEMKYIQYKLKQ